MTGLHIVRALTLTNPWAHMIAHEGKDVENRTWFGARRVDELLIHAGKSFDRHAGPFLAELGITAPDPGAIATSAIVAVARLDSVCSVSYHQPDVDCGCGRWAAAGQHHWKLGRRQDGTVDIRPLAEPVPCRGTLGLWVPKPDLLNAVHAQLAAADPEHTAAR